MTATSCLLSCAESETAAATIRKNRIPALYPTLPDSVDCKTILRACRDRVHSSIMSISQFIGLALALLAVVQNTNTKPDTRIYSDMRWRSIGPTRAGRARAGMYKSTDAGKTWTHLGLSDSQMIANIDVDPRNPNRLFVAVLGHPYDPNPERGVFRSTDGGASFQKVLFKDDYTSADEVII